MTRLDKKVRSKLWLLTDIFIGAVKIFQFNSMFITYQQSHIINRQTFENITETGLQVYSLVVEDKDTE